MLARAAGREWWPLSVLALVAGGRLRRLAVLTGGVRAVDALRSRAGRAEAPGPAAVVALAALDDVAYGTGVWRGAARRRSLRALLPRLVPTGLSTLSTSAVEGAGPHRPVGADG